MIVAALPYLPKFKIHSCTIETTIPLFIVLYYIIVLHWYLTYLVLVDIPQRILNILFYYILQEVCCTTKYIVSIIVFWESTYGHIAVWLVLWLWCLTPLSIISQLCRRQSLLLLGETKVSVENYWPDVSHWQTLSHNVVYRVHLAN